MCTPIDRAAVVSSACRWVSVEDSALEKHRLKRSWKAAAVEFARYALLRCDLVKPSRMTFKDALGDWTSQYTRWDRSPASLSEWAKHETHEFEADDYRLVLLRQALGTKRSINISRRSDTEASAFGGFLPVAVDDAKDMHDPKNKTLVVDQPLTLTVQISGFMGSGQGCYLMDKWGVKERGFSGERNGYRDKEVHESGKPKIFEMKTIREDRIEVVVRATMDYERNERQSVLSFA